MQKAEFIHQEKLLVSISVIRCYKSYVTSENINHLKSFRILDYKVIWI